MTRRGRLIAIVDDSPEDRAAVRRQLAQDPAGYEFVEYESGPAAVEACRAAPPDCLLLDFDLGETDGLETLDRLTDGTGTAPFAVVMLTGRGSEAIAVQALKRGALDYLTKGVESPDGLRQTVAEALTKFADRPGVERQQAERERSHKADVQAAPGRERLVLVVDDSAEDREAARRALSRGRPAYRVLEVGTAAEGLALSRSAGIDCLLLDYSLPDADGLEFLHELTGGSGIAPFPVIMLTGRGDEDVAVQALKCGAMDYLVKGRSRPEILRDAVEQAVDRMSARRAREEQRRLLERLESESRLRADQLAEADRSKDEFLAMLAHELRNPLAPIANALYLLRRVDSLPSEAVGMVEVADRQVKHLARLIEDLMEVSRITRGKIALKKEVVDLGVVVRRAADAARALIEGRRHELVVEVPEGPIFLDADPTRLEQVFSNLLNNAAKYTDPGGRVAVLVARDGPSAVVRVRDNGVGIDAETLPRVFELFAQSDRSLDRASGGLGIGLTLVRALAEQHGGSVEARSDGPGSGSEFAVRLPVLAGAAAVAPEPGPAGMDHDTPLRLLVVDDNVDAALLMATLFRTFGNEVHLAHDGVAGLDAVRELRPDMVFLDIGLPRMDGYEVARAVTSEFGGGSPVLVAVTGYGQAEDRGRSKQVGFRHYLVKPVNPVDLLRVVAEAHGQTMPGGAAV